MLFGSKFEKKFVSCFNNDPAAAAADGDQVTKGSAGGAPAADPADRIAALEKQIADFMKAQANPTAARSDDSDLQARARMARDKSDQDMARTRQLENALKFNLKSAEFLKQNESLLPKDVSDIFKQAEKENFSDAIEKDSAIKAGMVQSFFAVQSNVDLLTSGQKSMLEDYLRLTKTEKQTRAQHMHDMVFEPAFEMLKRVKKAEALSKGYGGSDAEAAYRQKLMASTRKHYLGEK